MPLKMFALPLILFSTEFTAIIQFQPMWFQVFAENRFLIFY